MTAIFILKVGVVSEEKLLDLLEIAMSGDTTETVKRSRELMDSGTDPMALMSQLAGLIMDIIAGTYKLADVACCNGSAVGGRSCEYTQPYLIVLLVFSAHSFFLPLHLYLFSS
jgi:hypothetical protein